jgi:cysteine desulfurase
MGQDAERIVKQARADIAAFVGARAEQILFTGSGTESDNLAVHAAFKNLARISGKRIAVSAVEHPAVAASALQLAKYGVEAITLPVDAYGVLRTEALEDALDSAAAAQRTALISVMHVNNELGTIQPLAEIARIRDRVNKRYGSDILLHTDAIQSFGKLPIDVTLCAPSALRPSAHAERPQDAQASDGPDANLSAVDFISFSAHKIHGPKGVGALYAARPARLDPVICGGGQESGMRSGTENVPGIAGFGAAVQACAADVADATGATETTAAAGGGSSCEENGKRVAALRGRLLQGITDAIPDVRVNSPAEASAVGAPGYCSPYILNVSFLGTRGEVLLHDLEQHGVFVSTGSACANIGKSGKGGAAKSNSVLAAIGLTPKEAEGAIRFSFSRYNTEDEIAYTLEHLSAAVKRYRSIGAFR